MTRSAADAALLSSRGCWDAFGDATAKCIADGARTLGQLWQAAYDANTAGDFAVRSSSPSFKPLYEKKTFLPSLQSGES